MYLNMISIFKQRMKNPLVKETFVYTVTDVIGKAMSFVLLPIVSFYMPPEELGIATNFTVIATLVSLFAGLALVNSLPYFYYEQKKEENSLMISNLLILCALHCLFLTVVIFFLHKVIFSYLQLSLFIQLLGGIYVIGMLVSQTSLNLIRLENNARQYAYFQIFQIVFHAGAVLFFVMVLREGGVGKIYAETIVFLLMGLIHLFVLFKKGYIKIQWSSTWVKKLLKFGVPLLPHSVSFWLKGGMDKVFITTFCGLQYNGLYSMAISIGGIYTMFVQSFFNAYTPYLQKKLTIFDDGTDYSYWQEKVKIVNQTYILFALFGLVGGLALVGSWIVFNYMIDKSYLPAMDYMPLVILANFIYIFYSFTIQYIYKRKKTAIMGCITFSGSIIQMLLSYWLIRDCGVMGAVYSLLIGNILITLGISKYSSIVYKMPWNIFARRK